MTAARVRTTAGLLILIVAKKFARASDANARGRRRDAAVTLA
jgi:hypothetical protein